MRVARVGLLLHRGAFAWVHSGFRVSKHCRDRSWEAYLGNPGLRALPVVGLARQAAPSGGVADRQVAGAAVLVVLTAGGRLRVSCHTSACGIAGYT